jgi:release factor glutamine methyltransferase
MVYEPAEDSILLQKFVKKYSRGLVLDMGCGSGIQSFSAAPTSSLVVGLDIDHDAVKFCNKKNEFENVHFFKSNLFQIFDEYFFFYDEIDKKLEIYEQNKVKDKDKRYALVKKQIKFDLIIFNPPYLPQELPENDLPSEGGKLGYELIARFFDGVKSYIKKDGRIIMVFSSLTNKSRVNDIIHKNGFNYIELEKQHIFFEDIYVYYATKK